MNETARKGVHILFGFGIAALIQLLGKDLALSVLLGLLMGGLLLSDLITRGHRILLISRLVHDLERPGVMPGRGAIFFAFSSTFSLFFFPARVVVPAILTLSVLDGVSNLVGRYAGKYRIWNGKSWEGTCAGIAAAAAVLWILITPPQALAIALAAGLVEFVSPVDDNLVLPPVTCLLLMVIS